MTLSTLIKKGGLAKVATATAATIATQQANQSVTVAPVATVTVAENPQLPRELTAGEETSIRAWLTYIEETDADIITKLLIKCRVDSKARQYYLQQAEEVPKTTTINVGITCAKCIYFERIDHPHLGHCAKGEPEPIVGLWDSDRRYCDKFITCSTQTIGIQTSASKDKNKVTTH